MARRPTREPDFDRELADLPAELRWRERKARVEAVLFATAKRVGRDVLARVVGRASALDLLLDDGCAGGRSTSSGQGSPTPSTRGPRSNPRSASPSTSRPTRSSSQNSRRGC